MMAEFLPIHLPVRFPDQIFIDQASFTAGGNRNFNPFPGKMQRFVSEDEEAYNI